MVSLLATLTVTFLLLPASATNFTVGVVAPLSGAKASTGKNFLSGLEWWQKKVNEAGGIPKKDGSRNPVVLVVKDTETNSTKAGEQVVQLAGLGVDALVNTFTAHNVAVNMAMEANNVERVLLHCSGGTPAQYGDIALGVPRWPFQFGVMIPSDTYAVAFFRLMAVRRKSGIVDNAKVAFIYNEVNPFTKYTCESTMKHAQDYGLDIVLNEKFDGNHQDQGNKDNVRKWVRRMKAEGVGTLIGCTWVNDGLMLQEIIVEEQLDLMANMITIAPTNPSWNQRFPKNASTGKSDGDYVLSPVQWHHTQRFPDASSVGSTSEFGEDFKTGTGNYPNYLLSACTAAGVFLERAMGKTSWEATDLDSSSERLRASMRDLMESTVYGDVRFDRHNQNVGHEPAMLQILESAQTSVLPESNSKDQIIFPMPTWQSRRGCPPATYNNGQACIPCEANRYSTEFDAHACQLCPAGTDQPEIGQSSCVQCQPGKFRSAGTDAGCLPCDAGRYSSLSGASLCEACAPGTFKSHAGTELCTECFVGKYMGSTAATACEDCRQGSMANTTGLEECDRCPSSTYQDTKGNSSCSMCSDHIPGSDTRFQGASAKTDCECPKGRFFLPGPNDERDVCENCLDGLSCKGGMGPPIAAVGHMMMVSEPLSVYKCHPTNSCPGGEAGVCAGGRVGKACAQCPDGQIMKVDTCEPCANGDEVAVWFVWPSIVAAIVVFYYVNTSQKSAKASTMFCTATMFGMMINLLQMFSVFNMFSVPWPGKFKNMLSFLGILNLDFDMVSISCAYGNSAAMKYAVSAIFFPAIICAVFMGLFISKIVFSRWPMHQWTLPRTFTTAGSIGQMAFVTMASTGFGSLTCYSHPNGLSSLQRFPHVICWTSEHFALVIPGACLLGFTVSFYALALYLAVVVPKKAALGDVNFLSSTRFLFSRFHADCWWWGCVLMMRALCFTIIPVVARDNGRLQLLLVNLVLITAAVFQIRCWSWKVPLLNVADACICILMAMTSTTASAFMEKETGNSYKAFSNLLMAQVGLLYGLCGVVLIMSLAFVFRRGPMGEAHDFFNLQTSPSVAALTLQFLDLVKTTESLDDQEDTIKGVFKELPFYDVMTVDHALKIFSVSGLVNTFGKRLSSSRVMPRRISVSSSNSANNAPTPRLSVTSVNSADLPTLLSSAPADVASKNRDEEEDDQDEAVVI